MRFVTVAAVVDGAPAARMYEALADLARYPELTDAVLSVTVERLAPDSVRSSWTVRLRRGILRWTERDTFDRQAMTIDFEQVAGDLDVFRGRWSVLAPEAGGRQARISFDAALDLGMPTVATILEPIAARALGESVALIMGGVAAAAGGTVTDRQTRDGPEPAGLD